MHQKNHIKIFFILILLQVTFLAGVNPEISIAWEKFVNSPDNEIIMECCRKMETDLSYPIDDFLVDYTKSTYKESVFLLLEDKIGLDTSKIKILKIHRGYGSERSMQGEEDQFPPVFQVFDENNNLIYVVKIFPSISYLQRELNALEKLINFPNPSCFNTVAPVAVGKTRSCYGVLVETPASGRLLSEYAEALKQDNNLNNKEIFSKALKTLAQAVSKLHVTKSRSNIEWCSVRIPG